MSALPSVARVHRGPSAVINLTRPRRAAL